MYGNSLGKSRWSSPAFQIAPKTLCKAFHKKYFAQSHHHTRTHSLKEPHHEKPRPHPQRSPNHPRQPCSLNRPLRPACSVSAYCSTVERDCSTMLLISSGKERISISSMRVEESGTRRPCSHSCSVLKFKRYVSTNTR